MERRLPQSTRTIQWHLYNFQALKNIKVSVSQQKVAVFVFIVPEESAEGEGAAAGVEPLRSFAASPADAYKESAPYQPLLKMQRRVRCESYPRKEMSLHRVN